MKGKAIIPLVLGLGIGLIAVKFGVNALKKAQAASGPTEKFSVVRAKQDIAPFMEITEEMVELVKTPDNPFAPANDRISKIEDAVGRVTAKMVLQRSPVLLSMLAPPKTQPGMVGRIPPGFRAVSVKIDEVTGVAYQLQPGSWVDVIVVMDVDSGNRRRGRETIAEVILQHIQVAAIGRATTNPEGSSGPVKPAKSATLLVAEADVPKLHLAATRGKITLSMRGSDDTKSAKPVVARSSELFQGLYKPEPAPSPWHTATARPPVAPVQAHDPRHGVTVYRRSTSPNAPILVERITFASARSATIVDVTDGPIGGTAMLMRGGAVDRAPQNRSVSPQRSDVGVAKQYDRRIEDE